MEDSAASSPKPVRRPVKIPVIFAPIYIPLFLLLAAASIPWTYVHRAVQRRQERKFREQMKGAGRLMQWDEFKQVETSGEGTVIGEYLSMKGPFRLWWTPENVQVESPHNWKREHHFAIAEPEFLPFFEWCYARFTSP